jgi:hypothetical protein
MAYLTVNLSDEKDVRFGMRQLTRASARLKDQDEAQREREWLGSKSPEEARVQARTRLGEAIRELLETRTGRMLLIPFVTSFPENQPVTLDEISQIIECEPGVDPMRKAHSLVAGLGRFETPREIKIFEQIGFKPQRYRMVALVWDTIQKELKDRQQRN